MKSTVGALKRNLVLAAYPHGGGEHLYPHGAVLGMDGLDLEAAQDARIKDKFVTFESLKQRKEDE